MRILSYPELPALLRGKRRCGWTSCLQEKIGRPMHRLRARFFLNREFGSFFIAQTGSPRINLILPGVLLLDLLLL